jgi:predicted RNA binding protein YcfA (HicA-like mRNA interferase family)
VPGLPIISGRDVVRALTRAGFVVDRIAGSHHVLTHPSDSRRTVTVPVHQGRDLKPGTLRAIIRQAGFTVDEFRKLL